MPSKEEKENDGFHGWNVEEVIIRQERLKRLGTKGNDVISMCEFQKEVLPRLM